MIYIHIEKKDGILLSIKVALEFLNNNINIQIYKKNKNEKKRRIYI